LGKPGRKERFRTGAALCDPAPGAGQGERYAWPDFCKGTE